MSFYVREEEDVERAVALLARSYELAREQQARKNAERRQLLTLEPAPRFILPAWWKRLLR